MSEKLLDIQNLRVRYGSNRHGPCAVDDVSMTIGVGESVGLVGESGSGKTTIGAAVLGLAPASEGSIWFNGEDITHASRARRRQLSAGLQVVFQDTNGTLNPVRTIGQTLAEPLLVHRKLGKRETQDAVDEMLGRVGLDASVSSRYPNHFSGGQRQRIAIARALMLSPALVVCDEAVSALDLSIQAQVLNLLIDLQRELQLSYLFISHDLDVVRHMTDRLYVLNKGKVVESGDSTDVYEAPQDLYTKTLLASIPVPDPAAQTARRAKRHALQMANRTTATPDDGSE